jgi:hypothetical protein
MTDSRDKVLLLVDGGDIALLGLLADHLSDQLHSTRGLRYAYRDPIGVLLTDSLGFSLALVCRA